MLKHKNGEISCKRICQGQIDLIILMGESVLNILEFEESVMMVVGITGYENSRRMKAYLSTEFKNDFVVRDGKIFLLEETKSLTFD